MEEIRYELRPELSDDVLDALFAAAWPTHRSRSFQSVLAHGLGYAGAFASTRLIGFVNVAWDGGSHAFLLDPTVHPEFRRRGVGTQLVRRAAQLARQGGAEWLHVDYEPWLDGFYRGCGFVPTAAGLMRLT